MTYSVVDSYNHQEGPWCWCRPSVRDEGFAIVVRHRDVEESDLAGRKLFGGEAFEVDPIVWYVNEYPTGFGNWTRS